jgi:putative acetyltransferase
MATEEQTMFEVIIDGIDPVAIVRRFRPQDAEAVSALYARSVRTLGPRFYAPDQVAAWAALTPGPAEFNAAYTDGRIALLVELDHRLAAFGDVNIAGKLQYFYCAPEWSGKGVAGLLYARLEKAAIAARVPELRVEASELARPFFARRGFVWLGRQDFTLGGVPIHNHCMIKAI